MQVVDRVLRYTLRFAGNQSMSPETDNNTNLHTVIGENRDIMLRLNETLEGLNTRQGKTSGFLWAGLLVPLLLSLLLLYLIYSISSQAESLPAGLQGENMRMERMEESLTLMTTNLEEIQAAMLSINGYMQAISHDIGRLDEADSPLVSMDTHTVRLVALRRVHVAAGAPAAPPWRPTVCPRPLVAQWPLPTAALFGLAVLGWHWWWHYRNQ